MKAKSALVEQWRQEPTTVFRLIVRVTGELVQNSSQLRERGIRVRRKCRLINGLAVEATGAQAEALLQEPWVLSLEPDEPVRTWPQST